MKKYLFLSLFLASAAYGAPREVSYKDVIGPARSTNAVNITSGTAPVFITAPTDNRSRNCLTQLHVSADKTMVQGNFTVNILNGGTTTYIVHASSGNAVNLNWPEENPWCASPGAVLGITATSLFLVPTTLTLDMNYQGYTY